MADKTVSRRQFVATVGAVVGAVEVAAPPPAVASPPQPGQTTAPAPAATTETQAATHVGGYQFLGVGEIAIVQAVANRIIPADDLGPGAGDAGVAVYIDRALAGFYRDNQPDYHRGLAAMDHLARSRFDGGFAGLALAEQDELLREMEAGNAAGFDVPGARVFFEMLRRHVMEGLMADPVYGGNHDFIGWRLVNFPGPVSSYRAEEMQSGQVLNKPFVSLASWFQR